MNKYALSKDWIKKNSHLIKQGYNIAITDKYDISSSDDVFNLLQIIDPSNATQENAEIFSGALQLFVDNLKKRFEISNNKKVRMIN